MKEEKSKKSSHVKKPKDSKVKTDEVKIEEVQEVKKKTGWYDQKYCRMLITHMTSGKSFESFGGVEGVWVGRSTLYKWAEENPEFATAREIGQSARLNHQETQLMLMSRGIEIKDSNGKVTFHPKHGKPQTIQWMMKCQNPDIYVEKKEINHKSSDGSMKPTFIFEEVDGDSDKD